jgi:Fur family ferric uptake transcriptional regulator
MAWERDIRLGRFTLMILRYHNMIEFEDCKPSIDVMERKTRQRDAIRSAIQKSKQPLLPQEILAKARVAAPGLGLATIYRNLKTLVAEGAVQVITLPGDNPRYETTASDHHHHFQCTTCQRVYDVPGCPGNLRGLAPRGFRVERHEVTLYGRCSACGKPGARAAQ